MCILKASSLSTLIANNKSNVPQNLNFLYLYKRKHDGMMLRFRHIR